MEEERFSQSIEGEEEAISFFPSFPGGVEISYGVICPRKLWLYAHHLGQEQNSERVALGRLLHESSYRQEVKEIALTETTRIDFFSGPRVVHEVKLSRSMERAHLFQVLYYLYLLEQFGIISVRGLIHYPKQRRTREVELTEDNRKALQTANKAKRGTCLRRTK